MSNGAFFFILRPELSENFLSSCSTCSHPEKEFLNTKSKSSATRFNFFTILLQSMPTISGLFLILIAKISIAKMKNNGLNGQP